MTHELTKQPEQCAECRDSLEHGARRHGLTSEALLRNLPTIHGYEMERAADDHTATQDTAIARAVRAAAGTENPVTWLLQPHGSRETPSARTDNVMRRACALDAVANALRAEIEAQR